MKDMNSEKVYVSLVKLIQLKITRETSESLSVFLALSQDVEICLPLISCFITCTYFQKSGITDSGLNAYQGLSFRKAEKMMAFTDYIFYLIYLYLSWQVQHLIVCRRFHLCDLYINSLTVLSLGIVMIRLAQLCIRATVHHCTTMSLLCNRLNLCIKMYFFPTLGWEVRCL